MLQFDNPYFVLLSGLMIGLVHAFEPDHISAVSTQLLHKEKSTSTTSSFLRKITVISSLKGMFWGMGHTSSILLVGLLIAGLSLNLSSSFFLSAELVVGFMLIVLAILAVLNKNILTQRHIHPHSHGDKVHVHHHDHNGLHKHNHKSLVIGSIHGLAGSGSIVILAASSLNSFENVVLFLTIFGIGSIVGMTAVSGLLGVPFVLLSKMGRVTTYFRCAVAAITFVIGINIVYEILHEGTLLI